MILISEANRLNQGYVIILLSGLTDKGIGLVTE